MGALLALAEVHRLVLAGGIDRLDSGLDARAGHFQERHGILGIATAVFGPGLPQHALGAFDAVDDLVVALVHRTSSSSVESGLMTKSSFWLMDRPLMPST